jgi:hypothetical protein
MVTRGQEMQTSLMVSRPGRLDEGIATNGEIGNYYGLSWGVLTAE